MSRPETAARGVARIPAERSDPEVGSRPRASAAVGLLTSLLFAGSAVGLGAQPGGHAPHAARPQVLPRPLLRGAFSRPREPDRPLPGRLRLTLPWPRLFTGKGAGRFDGSGPGRDGGQLALSLDSGRLHFEGSLQELDPPLRRNVAPVPGDRKRFGNTSGIRRTAMNLNYQTGTRSALSFSQSRLTAHGANAERRRFAFEGDRPLALSFETGQVDRGFDRAAQLDGIERTLFARERGFRWQELTARLRLAEWAMIDGTRYRSRGEERTRRRSQAALTLTPGPGMRILLRDERRDEHSQSGKTQRTRTRTLQWEHAFSSRTKLRALRERVEQEQGAGSRTRQSWELQTGIGKDWKLRGKLGRTDGKDAKRQRNFQAAVTGTLGKGWQLSAAAAGRSGGGTPGMRQGTLTLSGSKGSMGGILPKTGLSLALTSAAGIRMTPAPSGSAETVAPRPPGSRWQSLALLTNTNLGRSLLTLGVQSLMMPGNDAGGLAFWWRSTGSRRLQWELRRTWSELVAGVFGPRERIAVSYRWGHYRLGLATALNPERVRVQPTLGLRASTLDFQTRIGATTLGLTYGTFADGVRGHTSRLRRLTLETAWSHQGSLRLNYEANHTPAPTPSLPSQLLALTARQKVAVDQFFDLGIEAQRWKGRALASDLTWRLDLRLQF